jgi:hypothetical protein
MKRISLISNSSIQYYKYEFSVKSNFNKKLYFTEKFDPIIADVTYHSVQRMKVDGDDRYYLADDLIENHFFVNNKITEKHDFTLIEELHDFYESNNINSILRKFKNKWLPIPYFNNNSINTDVLFPTDWVRIYFDIDNEINKIKIIIAIDTTLAKDESDITGPQLSLNSDNNIFKLCSQENDILKYLSHESSLWIRDYIFQSYYSSESEQPIEHPYKQHISDYILLLKWIDSIEETPDFQLFSDDTKKIPVDLVVDIGNSATCALLFENQEGENFTFKKVKKLLIQDYSKPELEYDSPFPMNLIFSELSFGKIDRRNYHNNKFKIPSFVRIGFEAENLINNSSLIDVYGRELKISNSSPKRYLWDTKQSEIEWENYPDKNIINKVYLSGISEQLNIDGTLKMDTDPGASMSLFSRNSLMKFVFLEMLVHAYVQINSFNFRKEHGNITTPRTLKRITISCPTGMIQFEQIALRKAAEDACKLLNNYVKYYFDSNENKFWFELPEIIPSINDISKKISDIELKKDWIYDEATSCQLVFVYSLLSKKLKGNSYVIDNYLLKNKNKITVGSIDIGGGTTDVMIADYFIDKNQNGLNVKPNPLYWDTFRLAGDDLLKSIIQKIVIKEIENYGLNNNIKDISDKVNGFFGINNNNINQELKIMRKAFIQQVAIPVAIYYLKNANYSQKTNLKINEILSNQFSNKDLLVKFENYFGFNLLDIQCEVNPNTTNIIINSVFDRLIRQISLIMNQFQCDYVVLSGKPFLLKSMENLVLQYASVSSLNLINLNSYWIGKWFPFSDNSGKVEDSKTMVSVGALISLMSDKLDKLDDFKIDSSLIKNKLISSANFIVYKKDNEYSVLLSPSKNENQAIVSEFPFQIGFSKFETINYQFSNLCSVNINNVEIIRVLKNRFPNKDTAFYDEKLLIEITKIKGALPLKITFSRNFEDSKEDIKIENIVDSFGEDKPVNFFKLNYQTLEDENGYWIDTCELIY